MNTKFGWFTNLLFCFMATLFVACQPRYQSSSELTSVPESISLVSTLNASSFVGSEHPAIKIRVSDKSQKPIPKVTISVVTNSGTATLPSTKTDAKGEAIIHWQFGTMIGQYQLTISAVKNNFSISRVLNMNLNPTSVSASTSSITGTSSIAADGLSQSTITIQLKAADGTPIVGETPTFAATDTASTNIYGPCSASDNQGESLCTLASSTAETKTLRLLSPVALTGSTVTFNSVTVLTSLRFSTQPVASSTDSNFSTQPVVTAYYQDGSIATNDSTSSISLTPYSGTNCTGTLDNSTLGGSLSQTLLAGIATFSGLKPLKTSIRSLKATLGGLSVCSRYFNVNPGAPVAIAKNGGDTQTGTVHTAVSDLSVIVTDAQQNIVPYATINWSVLSGGGSLSTASSTTNTLGISSSTLTLGNTAGANTVKAMINGTSASVTFTATATSAAAAGISVSAGNSQTATVATTLATPLAAIVRDIYLNPVSNVTVSWSVQSGGGSLSSYSSTTDASGVATSLLTLGQLVGANTVTATINGTTTSTTFTATGTAAAPVSVAISSGNSQTGTVGQALGAALTVIVKDTYSNVVSGATVNWAVATGGGSFSSSSTTTDASGLASSSFTLGAISGAQSATATLNGTSSSVTFSASASSASASALAISSGNSQTGTVAQALSSAFKVEVRDSLNNLVPNATINWSVTAGGGSLSASSSVSNASGIASSTLTLGQLVGTNSVTATISGTSTSVTFSATATAGAAATIAISSGNTQTGTVGAALSTPFSVVIKDSNNNVVPSATVDWTVLSGAGSLSTSSTTTNGSGLASSTLTLGTTAGANSVKATINGTSTSVTFSATGAAAAPATITIAAGNNQTGTVGSPLPIHYSVLVKDAFNNPVSSTTIQWNVVSGSGSLSSSTSSTDATGVAEIIHTLGNAAGANSVSATVSGQALLNQVFSATGVAGAASQLQIIAGNNQSAFLGAALSTQLKVQVLDSLNNVVSGATVNWSASSGSASPSSSTSDASGFASTTATVGLSSGAQTISATLNGTSSSVAFSYTANVAVPTNLAATAGTNSASVSWSVVTGASSYKIYSSTTSGSGYTLLGTSATNSYNASLLSGATYYLAVTAINGSQESIKSSEVTVTPLADTWIKQLGFSTARKYLANKLNSNGREVCMDLAIPQPDAVFCAGYTTGNFGDVSAGDLDAVVMKTNGVGEIVWITQFGANTMKNFGDASGEDVINKIAVIGDSVYVTGHTTGSLGEASGGNYDMFVAKLNASTGDIQWIKQLGATTKAPGGNNSGEEYGFGLAVNNGGEIFVAGKTAGSMGEPFGGGDFDAFMLKMDPEGNILWFKQFGQDTRINGRDNNATDSCESLALSPDQSTLYCGGNTNGNMTEDNGGYGDMVVIAVVAPSGDLIWGHQLGNISAPGASSADDMCGSIAVDASSNIYCGGATDGSLGETNGGGRDAVVVQFRPDGSLGFITQLGAVTAPGSTSIDYCQDVATPMDGTPGVYCGGSTQGSLSGVSAGGADAFMMRINQFGHVDWINQLNQSYFLMSGANQGDDICYGIAVDVTGTVYCGGWTTGGVSDHNRNNSEDIFIVKMDATSIQRFIQLGDSYLVSGLVSGAAGDDYCSSMARDTNGNIYCAGYTDGSLGESLGGEVDAVVVKFDKSGILQWVRQLGVETMSALHGDPSSKDIFTSVAVDSNGNIYAGGFSAGNLMENNGAPGSGSGDPIMLKLNTNGNVIWLKQFGADTRFAGGDNSGDDHCSAVAVDSVNGFVYCAGDTYAMGEKNSGGTTDAYVMKLSLDGELIKIFQLGDVTSFNGSDNSQYDSVAAMTIDSESKVFLAGQTNGSLGQANLGQGDGFILALNSDLLPLWIKQFGSTDGEYDGCRGIAAVSTNENLIACSGITYGNMEAMTSNSSTDGFVIALNKDTGDQAWVTQYGTTSTEEECTTLTSDINGNLYCGGYTYGHLVEDPAYGYDSFVMKLNVNGVLQWSTQFGAVTHIPSFDNAADQYVYGLSVDHEGSVFGVGITMGSTGEINGSQKIYNNNDIYLFKINSAGALQ